MNCRGILRLDGVVLVDPNVMRRLEDAISDSSSDSGSEPEIDPARRPRAVFVDPATIARHPDFRRDPFFLEADWHLLGTGCILGVRNQLETEGCFAIVIVTTMYADMYLHRDVFEPCQASAQELVDLLQKVAVIGLPRETTRKGNPSSFDTAFTYVKLFGLFPEEAYPWNGYYNDVPKKYHIEDPDSKIYIDDFQWIENHSEVMERLKIQPVAAGMYNFEYCHLDAEGIIHGPTPEEIEEINNKIRMAELYGKSYPTLFHAITLIGFGGVEGTNDYYLIQDSHGPHCGRDGFFKVRRNAVFCFCYPVGTRRRERRRVVELTKQFARLSISRPSLVEDRAEHEAMDITEQFARLSLS